MTLIEIFNTIIVKINSIICNIRNIQVYLGTRTSTDPNTLTGRVAILEGMNVIDLTNLFDQNGKIKCEYIPQDCSGSGSSTGHIEWEDPVPSEVQFIEW